MTLSSSASHSDSLLPGLPAPTAAAPSGTTPPTPAVAGTADFSALFQQVAAAPAASRPTEPAAPVLGAGQMPASLTAAPVTQGAFPNRPPSAAPAVPDLVSAAPGLAAETPAAGRWFTPSTPPADAEASPAEERTPTGAGVSGHGYRPRSGGRGESSRAGGGAVPALVPGAVQPAFLPAAPAPLSSLPVVDAGGEIDLLPTDTPATDSRLTATTPTPSSLADASLGSVGTSAVAPEVAPPTPGVSRPTEAWSQEATPAAAVGRREGTRPGLRAVAGQGNNDSAPGLHRAMGQGEESAPGTRTRTRAGWPEMLPAAGSLDGTQLAASGFPALDEGNSRSASSDLRSSPAASVVSDPPQAGGGLQDFATAPAPVPPPVVAAVPASPATAASRATSATPATRAMRATPATSSKAEASATAAAPIRVGSDATPAIPAVPASGASSSAPVTPAIPATPALPANRISTPETLVSTWGGTAASVPVVAPQGGAISLPPALTPEASPAPAMLPEKNAADFSAVPLAVTSENPVAGRATEAMISPLAAAASLEADDGIPTDLVPSIEGAPRESFPGLAARPLGRREKIAGYNAPEFTREITELGGTSKKTETFNLQSPVNSMMRDGMSAAFNRDAMPFPPPDLAPPALIASVFTERAAPMTPAEAVNVTPETATQAARAVEAVYTAAELSNQGDRQAVTLRFAMGEADLSVRVQVKDDEVHATFVTDSAELRAALTQECAAAGEASGRPFRLSADVTGGHDTGGSSAFAGDSAFSRREPHRAAAATENARFPGARPAQNDEPAAASAPRAAFRPTSLHLHTLA